MCDTDKPRLLDELEFEAKALIALIDASRKNGGPAVDSALRHRAQSTRDKCGEVCRRLGDH